MLRMEVGSGQGRKSIHSYALIKKAEGISEQAVRRAVSPPGGVPPVSCAFTHWAPSSVNINSRRSQASNLLLMSR